MPSYSDVPPGLPESLKAWRHIDALRDPLWWKPWDLLRPLFSKAGYELYEAHTHGRFTTPKSPTPPALDSFGLYGDRSTFSRIRKIAHVFAARDRQNRDVVLKLISSRDEGRIERQILDKLNSEPLRSDPANPTVPVLEFIEVGEWGFAVFPLCNDCYERPFIGAFECLDFAEQVLEGLSFLHKHRIAHLDISNENIMVNYHGPIPPRTIWGPPGSLPQRISPPLPWRATFPVRYSFIDFGIGAVFAEEDEDEEGTGLGDARVVPVPEGREHRAPETMCESGGGRAYNPFAADVYQTARLFYGWFPDIADTNPTLLKLLQDMSSYNPLRRPSASSALARLRAILAHSHAHAQGIADDEEERELMWFRLVPRPHVIMFRDLLECGRWVLAGRFVWVVFKMKMGFFGRIRTLWSKKKDA